MQTQEVEVKFLIDDVNQLREGLDTLGAQSQKRVFESNRTFDDEDESLRRRQMLLRLRQDDHATLTVKTPVDTPSEEFKILNEIETRVSDIRAMESILDAIGYRLTRRYEKWRETFHLGELVLCIDEMPFGVFLELEGPGERIRETAARLDLQWSRRILLNYYDLFDIVREDMELGFPDITFALFANSQVDMQQYRQRIEAGDNPPADT